MSNSTLDRSTGDRSVQFLRFSTLAEARSFLFGMSCDPENIHSLRQVLHSEWLSGIRTLRRLHDHEVIDQAAMALVTGRLRISEIVRPTAGVGGIAPPVEEVEEDRESARAEAVEVATHWIEIELVDEEDEPVEGALYEITFPNGKVDRGKLDAQGRARYSRLQFDGECKVRFPEYDERAVGAFRGR